VFASLLLTLTLAGAAQAPPEVIAQIQVHGNMLTPEAEVVRLADVRVGMPFETTTIDAVTERLEATRRFVSVEVLKRYASIADPSQIILVVLVDDGRVQVNWSTGEVTAPSGLTGRRGPRLMFLPILGYEDGYGFSYGVRVAVPEPFGPRSRVAVPLSLGGEKLAGLELEKNLDRGPFNRVQGGGSVSRRENPFYEENDDRRRVWIRAEREFTRPLRASIRTGWDHASFFDASESFVSAGAEVAFDTRLDPILTRNAVYVRASWDHLMFRERDNVNRSALEARGYVGLIGQQVLVLRTIREDSSGPLPLYLKSLMGGTSNLRGFRAGSAAGDTLVGASAELQIPLTSPMSVGKLGVSAFTDAATVYEDGQRLSDQRFERSVGGSVWFSAAFVRVALSVAHGVGASTRVNFGAGVTF
jgi:outer membrane protein assembly factor BamA